MKITKVFSIVLSLHVGVILLVMFQPSCQTAGVRPETKAEEANNSVEPDQSFNQAVPSVEPERKFRKPGGIPADEFASPTRPGPGELIVPEERAPTTAGPVSPIIVPQDSGPRPIDLKPRDMAVYKIERGDTLWGIARKNGISLADLLDANPNLNKNGRLSIGQEVMIPSTGRSSSSTALATQPQVALSGTEGPDYTVQTGDTLSRIARKHDVKLSQLLQANGLSLSSVIRPGQKLVIPGGSGSESTEPEITENRVAPPGSLTHLVLRGENLSRIASIYGVSVSQIMDWNGLSNPGLIKVGQSLIVSPGESGRAQPAISEAVEEPKISPDQGGASLQDFFNESTDAERPIIDVPASP